MYIKVVGATVNAAVIAYHLVEGGHQVLWQPQDSSLIDTLDSPNLLFDDYELDYGLRHKISNKSLLIGDHDQEHLYRILVVALSNIQYQEKSVFEKILNQIHQYEYDLVVNYSNLGLGHTEELQKQLNMPPIAYIPDFLAEGNFIKSFYTPNLIVGCDDETKFELIREIFRSIFPLRLQFNFMSARAAEFTKLSISGFLATKISYMNDLSNVADALNIDIEEVRLAMAMDERVGGQYLYPGCGFGGNNLTRDILKLKEVVQESGNSNGLLDKIWDINENQKEIVFRKVWRLFDCDLKDKVIAIWGVSFKPNTKSLANSPSLKVLEAFWSQGAITQVHDPLALDALREIYPDQPLLKICDSPYKAAEGADVLCLVTEWKQYWSPNYVILSDVMRQCNLLDGRNIYNPDYVVKQGFKYIGIGREGS